jgi:hypothetical protein
MEVSLYYKQLLNYKEMYIAGGFNGLQKTRSIGAYHELIEITFNPSEAEASRTNEEAKAEAKSEEEPKTKKSSKSCATCGKQEGPLKKCAGCQEVYL